MKLDNFVVTAAVCAVLIVAPASPASAQQVFAYPKAGQSQQQQMQDRGECNQWAVGQTGYNPSAPQPPAEGYAPLPPPPETRSGVLGLGSGGMFRGRGLLGDAATGAALGAAGGAIAGNAGKGAAIGSLAGALLGGVKRRSRRQERAAWERQRQQQSQYQHQQMAMARQQGQQNYARAFAVCMNARNYQVQ